MLLTNNEIYTSVQALMSAFDNTEQKLPIKASFYLQKNKTALFNLAQDIEKTRMDIVQTYGTLNESGDAYTIPDDKVTEVTKELEDLFNLEQEVQIYKIKIDAFGDDVNLTNAQMEAIMFMIE